LLLPPAVPSGVTIIVTAALGASQVFAVAWIDSGVTAASSASSSAR
jgi:hypothetical protein